MSPSTRSDLKQEALLVLTIAIWGVNMPVLKAAVAVMPEHVVNAFRFLISTSTLGALYFTVYRGRLADLREAMQGHGLKIAALGLFGYVFYQLFFILGVERTTAGSAALIMAGAPIWTALLIRAMGFERLSLAGWTGLLTALSGTLIVVFYSAHEIHFTEATFTGNLLVFVAAGLWGAYTALQRPVLQHVPPPTLTFLGLLVALPILLGISIPYWQDVAWSSLPWWTWPALIYSGGLSVGLTFLIWSEAVQRVGAAHTAAYGNLTPFVALVSAYFMIGEPILLVQIGGGALIIAGLIIMRRSRAPEPVT